MGARITRMWFHQQDPNRIHYAIEVGDKTRHLYTHKDSPLGEMLALAIEEERKS